MHTIQFTNGKKFAYPVTKAVCVGRNYAEHAKELNNPIPSHPLLFLKPASAVVSCIDQINIPRGFGEVHHELELALLIGKPLFRCSAQQCLTSIVGYGLALDLTLRDVQNELKQKGQPWDKAKGFDASCPVTAFTPVSELTSDFTSDFELIRNGQQQQKGQTSDMLFGFGELLSEMTRYFSLNPGDIVLTGTPAGVGPLESGDVLELILESECLAKVSVQQS